MISRSGDGLSLLDIPLFFNLFNFKSYLLFTILLLSVYKIERSSMEISGISRKFAVIVKGMVGAGIEWGRPGSFPA